MSYSIDYFSCYYYEDGRRYTRAWISGYPSLETGYSGAPHPYTASLEHTLKTYLSSEHNLYASLKQLYSP